MLLQLCRSFLILFIIGGNLAYGAGKPIHVIGLMSGTSMDGIDVALLKTDGEKVYERGPGHTYEYSQDFRNKLGRLIKLGDQTPKEEVSALEKKLTQLHAKAVQSFILKFDIKQVDLIGFHGQTLWHKPEVHLTCQVGDGALLSDLTGISVVNDFRSADMRAGGQGAPLAPIYHRTLVEGQDFPVVLLNIGGVANITYIDDSTLIACDTGPGGALINDWMLKHTNTPFDQDGHVAAKGTPDISTVAHMLTHAYFDQVPPKSLDRQNFTHFSGLLENHSLEDGAATLTAFTAEAVKKIIQFLPQKPKKWFVCGGGRHNKTLMSMLSQAVEADVRPLEDIGFNGDFVEAELIAYLAARFLYDLPSSFPTTTGASSATKGGVLHH